MKSSILIRRRIRRITLKIYLFYSFLLHAIILLYLLSLPIYRGGIHLKSFGDFFVHLISDEGKSSRKSPLEYKYKISKSNEGTLGETKETKTDLKTEEIDVKESIERLEEEKKVVSEGKPELKIKEAEEIKIAQAVEEKKPLERLKDKEVLKEEVSAVEKKEIEVVKKEEPEAKEQETKKVIVQEAPPVEKPKVEKSKEAVKPAESPTLPEQKKDASLEPIPDKQLVPSVEELKEETMYLERVEKVVVTEKKEEHERAEKKEKVPEKVAEVKKPSEAKGVGKVSKKEASSGKGKKKKMAKAAIHKSERKAKKRKDTGTTFKGKTAKKGSYIKKSEAELSRIGEGEREKGAVQKTVAETTVSAEKNIEGKGAMGLPSRNTVVEGFSEDRIEDRGISFGEKSKQETAGNKGDGKAIAETFTLEKSGEPLKEGFLPKQEESKKHAMIAINPEAKEEKKTPLGIPVSDVFLAKDIKIEVYFHDAEISSFISHLLKKAHPMAHKKDDSGKPKEVDGVEEKSETYIADTPGVKRSLSVSKAEKAMYIFVIENKGGKACEADVVFRLFEGKAGERIKEVKPVELSTHAVVKFKFILPDAVFWDDEYYFTGTIESSDTLTKFNDKTGLIWKEEKDY